MRNMIQRATFTHDPFAAFDEFMNLVTGNAGSGDGCCAAPARMPLDIRERADEYVIEASAPGFRREDVDVEVHDGQLSISAKRESTSESGDESWIRRERVATSMARRVRLPEGVAGDGVTATLADGVLTVRIPKPAQLQPRRIEVT